MLRRIAIVLLAALAAIGVQPIVFLLWFMLPGLIRGQEFPVENVFTFLPYVVLIAAAYVILIGIPAFLLLRHYKRLSWSSLAAVAIVAANLPGALSPLWSEISFQWIGYIQAATLKSVHGLAGALAFYGVARQRRK